MKLRPSNFAYNIADWGHLISEPAKKKFQLKVIEDQALQASHFAVYQYAYEIKGGEEVEPEFIWDS